MKNKKLQTILIIIFLLLNCSLFLPFPKYVNKTLDGYKIEKQKRALDDKGDPIGDVEMEIKGDVQINIKGWYFDYLYKDDSTKIVYNIKENGEEIARCSITNGTGYVDDTLYDYFGVFLSTTGAYNAKLNSLYTLDISFTKDFNEIMFVDRGSEYTFEEYTIGKDEPDSSYTEPELPYITAYIAPKEAYESGTLYNFLTSYFYDYSSLD